MKYFLLFSFFIFLVSTSFGQDTQKEYALLTKKADSLFILPKYKEAVHLYLSAFDINGGLGKVGHRYKAASCWALLKNSDSAFGQLDKIANKGNFSNYEMIINDSNFNSLHSNPRWQLLIARIKENKNKLKFYPDY